MSKQTTAVGWLIEQMIDQMGIRIENTTIGCELFKKAKEMERTQTKQAYEAGQDDGYQYHVNDLPRYDSETWYDNTYGTGITRTANALGGLSVRGEIKVKWIF